MPPTVSPWIHWIPAACLPDHCNCEAVRAAWIAQPSAFWSSLAYWVAGIGILLGRRQKNDTLGLWVFSVLMLGSASLFAHGSMTEWAMAFDFGAICMLLLLPTLLRVTRNRISPSNLGLVIILELGLFCWGFHGAGKLTKISIALAIFVCSLAEHGIHEQGKIQNPGFKKSMGVLTGSFLLFLWDEAKFHCEPESWFQGHTLWHFGSAWAIYEYSRWRFKTSA